ncbi:MAG: hypothetical protein V7L20_14745 [Nostoc sp.]
MVKAGSWGSSGIEAVLERRIIEQEPSFLKSLSAPYWGDFPGQNITNTKVLP